MINDKSNYVFTVVANGLRRRSPSTSPNGYTRHTAVSGLRPVVGDAMHFEPETHGSWDLAIAERTLVGCVEPMAISSPPARTGIVAQLAYAARGGLRVSNSARPLPTPTSGSSTAIHSHLRCCWLRRPAFERQSYDPGHHIGRRAARRQSDRGI
jgi:hypothetical protein